MERGSPLTVSFRACNAFFLGFLLLHISGYQKHGHKNWWAATARAAVTWSLGIRSGGYGRTAPAEPVPVTDGAVPLVYATLFHPADGSC